MEVQMEAIELQKLHDQVMAMTPGEALRVLEIRLGSDTQAKAQYIDWVDAAAARVAAEAKAREVEAAQATYDAAERRADAAKQAHDQAVAAVEATSDAVGNANTELESAAQALQDARGSGGDDDGDDD